MLGIDRRTLQAVWTLFLFALTLLVIYNIGRTLIIFAIALILAHLLAPVVNLVERLFPPTIPRVASLAVVYVALIAVLVIGFIPIGSRISEEFATLAARLPEAVRGDPLANLPFPKWLEPFRPEVTSFIRDRVSELGNEIGPKLAEAGSSLIRGIGSILGAVLVPILSFFFLKDGAVLRDSIVDSFAPNRRELVDNIFADIHVLLAQYIRALVVLSLATFTFYSLFLAVIGGPYPVLLAGIAAALEFIPAVGPLAAAVAIVIAAVASAFNHVLLIVVFLGFYRLFQDYVLRDRKSVV